MISFTTLAFVLKTQDVGERDCLLTLFSSVRGKLDVLAKGVRTPASKLRAHINPLQLLDMHIIAQRRFTLAGSVIVSAYPRLREKLPNYIVAEHICEIIRLLYPFEHTDARAFERLHSAMTFCDSVILSPLHAVAFAAAVDLKFLVLSGVPLRFNACASCGKSSVKFLSLDGARCADCRSQTHSVACAPEILRFLDRALMGSLRGMVAFSLTPAIVSHAWEAVQYCLASHDVPQQLSESSIRSLLPTRMATTIHT